MNASILTSRDRQENVCLRAKNLAKGNCAAGRAVSTCTFAVILGLKLALGTGPVIAGSTAGGLLRSDGLHWFWGQAMARASEGCASKGCFFVFLQVPQFELEQAKRQAEEAVQALQREDGNPSSSNPSDETGPARPELAKEVQIPFLELLVRGGFLMIPIGLMSLLVVACALERALGLRRNKVIPPQLIRQLAALGTRPGGFDPRIAYRLCQLHPSAASNVIRSVLLKIGRPQMEVEQALRDAEEREASRLYSNVRWLSLAAGVTPLLGLLGTVWGMIKAFFVTANLPVGVNRAEYLADGIYVALVTTFAGLSVAIPAAVLAHLFEGRIQKLFRELDEIVLGFLPQLERFEGRLRFSPEKIRGEPFGPWDTSGPVPPPPPVVSPSRNLDDSSVLTDASPAEAVRSRGGRREDLDLAGE
jgi:biopolymer transport protein ExbB